MVATGCIIRPKMHGFRRTGQGLSGILRVRRFRGLWFNQAEGNARHDDVHI